MTLANAKSVNRQTLENVVRNAASEFTRRTAIASLASLSARRVEKANPRLTFFQSLCPTSFACSLAFLCVCRGGGKVTSALQWQRYAASQEEDWIEDRLVIEQMRRSEKVQNENSTTFTSFPLSFSQKNAQNVTRIFVLCLLRKGTS